MSDRWGPTVDCPVCGQTETAVNLVECPACGKVMCKYCMENHCEERDKTS